MQTSLPDEPMHFVQEVGQALDLVHEHPGPIGKSAKLSRETGDVRQVGLVQGFVQKSDFMRLRKLMADPGGLARSTRAQEEEGLRRSRQGALQVF
jgi:hypothetical protein